MKLISTIFYVVCVAIFLACGSDDTSTTSGEDTAASQPGATQAEAEAEHPAGGSMALTAAPGSSEDSKLSLDNRNINVEEFNKRRLASTDVVILDVRTSEEIAEGKVPGAIEIDYNRADFDAQIDKLDRTKEYLVYCSVGGRSGKTTYMMAEMGFEKVYNLEGGYTAWAAAEK